jgi:hypothetical protein
MNRDWYDSRRPADRCRAVGCPTPAGNTVTWNIAARPLLRRRRNSGAARECAHGTTIRQLWPVGQSRVGVNGPGKELHATVR